MADLGNAFVNIVPKAPGISGKIEGLLNEGSGGAESAGTGIGKKIIAGLSVAGIGAAVVSIIKQSFEAGGDLQQSFGGLDTLYGESSAMMKQFAADAASAGISMNTYAEQAVSFGASLKQAYGGDTLAAAQAANQAILDMADNAAKMGTPLESIQSAYQGFAKQNYTMLDNLKLGYGGTKEEMERLLADAQAISGVEYDITNLGDLYSAIHVVQEELGIAGVAADEAATTFTGSFGALKASWENVLAAMTTGEGMDEAMAHLNESVGNFANNVLTMLQNLVPQIPGLITSLVQVVIDHAPDFAAAGVELIAQLAVGLINALPDLVAKIPELHKRVLQAFGEIDWAQLGKDLINGIIKGLVNSATNLYNKVKDIIKNALKRGQDTAQTGSPSKLFANELGRWIPAGVAMGIDQNMSPVDRAMDHMVNGGLMAAQSDYRPVSATLGNDADRIISALNGLSLNANVSLQGDAKNLFKVVRQQNNTFTKATKYNPLAAGGY